MLPMKRSRVLLLLCAAIVTAGGITGCGGSDGDTTTETVVTTMTDTSSVSTQETTDLTQTQEANAFAVVYRDGKVTGDTAPSVKRGERVSITVTSDIADEAHFHGYDILTELSPGTSETFSFTADIPGKFELELHHHPTRLLTLTVR